MKPEPEDFYAALVDQRNAALDQLANALAENAALRREIERLSVVEGGDTACLRSR
ncbi:hypothetical protein LCGC14_1864770 [marine sediment metagenome]|uniref:Uncharacterized protein n=1 Tax=marine sediment metagenome TaxID=412755 RepID=A0A0F9GUT0_9ZZZZ